MPAVTFAAPILAGREEKWRRFVQEVSEVQKRGYEDCRRRLGIRNESVWLTRTNGGETALAYLETDDPDLLVVTLAASRESFDVWLKARLVEFHGGGSSRKTRQPAAELIFSHEGTSGGHHPTRSHHAPRTFPAGQEPSPGSHPPDWDSPRDRGHKT